METTAPNIQGLNQAEASVQPRVDPVETVQEPKKIETPRDQVSEVQSSSEQVKMSKKDVAEFVESFKALSDTLQTRVEFSVHEENHQVVVRVMDKESQQLIRQFPSEELLALQDKMKDLSGLLFNENI
ncbi:MAG: flagellar protein FlaG [Desulfobacterales bacterium]|nr:flagellar protein FlaG [Desulfobacterales bacterium]